jgi:hypothetical protein
MQIECTSEQSITLKVTNEGDNATDVFYSILAKCRAQALKKGFNNMFTQEEKEFLKELTDKVLTNEVGC